MFKDEFNEMISNFDEFMKKQGYYTVKDVSEKERVSEITVRAWISRGLIKNAIMINSKRYIPSNYKVEYTYKKRK